jgi:hypothetical protein
MAPLPLSSISRALGVIGFPGTQMFFLLLFFILLPSFVGDVGLKVVRPKLTWSGRLEASNISSTYLAPPPLEVP